MGSPQDGPGGDDEHPMQIDVKALNELKYGEVIGRIGAINIYAKGHATYEKHQPTSTWATARDKMDPGTNDPRNARSLKHHVLSFDACDGVTVKEAFTQIRNALQGIQAHISVGKVSETSYLVYVHKTDKKSIPDISITLADGSSREAVRYQFKRGGRQHVVEETFIALSNCVLESYSEIVASRVDARLNVSYDDLLSVYATLTEDQRTTLKGRLLSLPPKDRSASESALLRCMPVLASAVKRMDDLDNDARVINPFAPKITIAKLNSFKNLEQTGARLIAEDASNKEVFTLRDAFENFDVLRRYSLLILGGQRTSGFGKSQVALALACLWVKAKTLANNLPPGTLRVAVTSTLEGAKGIPWAPGWVWVLDECNASDEKQVIKMSTDLLKNLFDIGKPRTIGARNDDITVPPFVPVVITANSNSAQDWVGKRAEFDRPCQRRTITYVIRSPLLNPTWLRDEMADNLTDCDPTDERAKDIMRQSASSLRDFPPADPTGISFSSIVCPPRRS